MKRSMRNVYLTEGIDVDRLARTVAFNSFHENLVNTSLKDNPTRDRNIFSKPYRNKYVQIKSSFDIDKFCRGVEVWSVFKRYRFSNIDGNPLIYALKGENGWRFRSSEDYNNIIKQIELISEKFAKEHNYSAVLIVPSSKNVNNLLAEIVAKHLSECTYVNGVLRKMYVREVEDYVWSDNSNFRNYYKDNFNLKFNQLQEYFKKMPFNSRYPEDALYSRHKVLDDTMRRVIDRTLTVSDPTAYHDEINGNDILLIDDIISRGDSIRESIKVLKQAYSPKSITVLTLMSKI